MTPGPRRAWSELSEPVVASEQRPHKGGAHHESHNRRFVDDTRVLEIPTPTWQAFDQQFFEMQMSGQIPLSHQERAYTSPNWFTPEG